MRFPSVLQNTSCLVVFFLAGEFADAVTATTTATTTTTQPQQRTLWDHNNNDWENTNHNDNDWENSSNNNNDYWGSNSKNNNNLSDLTTHAKQYANELRGKVDADHNHWSEVKAQTLQKNYVESTSRKEHWKQQELHLKEYCESVNITPELCDEKRSQLQAERVTEISTLVDRVRNERHVQTQDRVRSLAYLKEDAQWHLQRMNDLHKEVESIKEEVVDDPLFRAEAEEAEDDIEEQMKKAKSDDEEITELLTVESQPKLVTTPMCFLLEDVTVPSGLVTVVPGTPTAAEQEEKIAKSVELSLELSFMELKYQIEVVGSVLVAEKFIEKNDNVVVVENGNNVVVDETLSTNTLGGGGGEEEDGEEDGDERTRRLGRLGGGRRRNNVVVSSTSSSSSSSSRNLARRSGRLLLTVEVGYTANDVTDVATSDVYNRRNRNRRNLKQKSRSLLDTIDLSVSTTIGDYAPTVLDAKGAIKITDSTTVSVIDCSDPLFL